MNDRIAITLSSFSEASPVPLALLNKSGFSIANNTFGRRLNREETLKLCGGARGIIAGVERYDSDLLERLAGVRVISRCGTGVDNIDLDAARKLGIIVKRAPDGPTQAVAELAVGLLLNLMRSISLADRRLRSGKWDKAYGSLLNGKTVGIIGLGRIGRRVAGLLRNFGVSLIAHDSCPAVHCDKVKMTGLRYLLGSSDIIMLHASGAGRIIDKKSMRTLKKGAYIVNLSRGSAIDEKALYQALKSGRIAGAALDVFQEEPYKGPLAGLENVILTPHIGSYAKETRIRMELQAGQNLLGGLKLRKRKMR